MADTFYRLAASEQVIQNPTIPAARVLHAAVRELRALYPNRSEMWASYIHVGP
jgi:hypothetical protein